MEKKLDISIATPNKQFQRLKDAIDSVEAS